MSNSECPACKSPNTAVARGKFSAGGFQALPNRSCEACGTAWRPACSEGLAVISIIAGGFTILGALFMSAMSPNAFVFGALLVFGVMPIIYGVRVLLRKAGQVQILGTVEKKKEKPAPEPLANWPGCKPCVSCEKGLELGSRICPHCGWTQPS